ncbi:MAG: hypothetical protein AAF184_05650 [Pseudomonadota bacterium]
MLTSATYLTYLTLSIAITVFVSQTLSRNGLAFLIEGFGGNIELAKSTNHLLVVGFYLINLGFVLLRMQTGVSIQHLEDLIVYQASGVGFVLLVLGIIHFLNMVLIHRFAKPRSRLHAHAAYREIQEARRRANELAAEEAAPSTP